MRKFLSFILIICIMLSMGAMLSSCDILKLSQLNTEPSDSKPTETEREKISYYRGEGTEENPYLINNADELIYLATITTAKENHTACTDIYFRLENDIDLGGMEWISIGGSIDENRWFEGHFDGNGHTVSNFKMTTESEVYPNAGFFGWVKNSKISNLTVSNFVIEMNDNARNHGVIAGAADNALIENCKAENCKIDLPQEDGNTRVGGIVGNMEGTVVKNCISNVEINVARNIEDTFNSDDFYIGGVVGYGVNSGYDENRIYAEVLDCSATGNITVQNKIRNMYVGGITGVGTRIKNCSYVGNISSVEKDYSSHLYIGGISGNTHHIEECVAIADLTAEIKGTPYIGGIVGTTGSTVKNCSYAGKIKASSSTFSSVAGGIAATLSEGTVIENCFAKAEMTALAPNDTKNYRSSSASAGGIVGECIYYVTIKNCIAVGSAVANASRPSAASAIARRMYGTDQIDPEIHGVFNCYAKMSNSALGEVSVDAEKVSNEQLADKSFYTETVGWSEEIWDFDSLDLQSEDYPVLK